MPIPAWIRRWLRPAAVKSRLIGHCYAVARADVEQTALPRAEARFRAEAAVKIAQARADAAREAAGAIAAAIEARTPPSRGHMCQAAPWCPYCARVHQAREDAAIARGIGQQAGSASRRPAA